MPSSGVTACRQWLRMFPGSRLLPRAIAFSVLNVSGALAALPASGADLDRPLEFHIPGQTLESALFAVCKQAHMQLLIAPDTANDRLVPALNGNLSTRAALDTLLRHTGLQYNAVGDVLSISQSDSPPGKVLRTSPPTSLHLAAADTSDADSHTLEEIVVTAQKKNERIQDVPVPMTAITADTLITNNQLKLQDYYTTIPGLNVTPAGSGSYQSLTIRGITTGTVENPTVAITVDEVPYGTSTSNGGGGNGQIVPDIDPGDLARVEVLRGPQGTLYGASSLGGLVKFVTVDPSTAGLSGRVEADLSAVHNGPEIGYGVRGSFNVPLSDTLAVRASFFSRLDPGYVTNVETGERGVNTAQGVGGRIAALWTPSDDFSVKVSALYQKIRGDGEPDVDKSINGYAGPPLGDLQQYHIPGSGDYERTVQAYSATFKAKFGLAELTAISGYNIQSFSDSFDETIYNGGFSQDTFGVGGANSPEFNTTRKFTQELRLSIPLGQRFEWVVGGFYTDENSKYVQDINATDLNTAAVVGLDLQDEFSATYMELAGFTDLTTHITDQFDVQLGARESQIRQTFSDKFVGPLDLVFFGAPSPFINPQVDSSANAFTYLVTPRFKISPDLMVYGRFASGYRPGGSNFGAGGIVPAAYSPDKTMNYELGVKGAFLDNRLSVDASAYYISWTKIQVAEIDPLDATAYIANGRDAKSEGLELSLQSRPKTGLTIGGWVTISDAELTDAFPPNSASYGTAGDRLPYSSRFSGSITIQQDIPLSSRVNSFFGGSVSYIGAREGEFTSTAVRTSLPGYSKLDLRAGIDYDAWKASLSLNNATDQRGVLYGGLNAYPPYGFVYIQPRMVALTLVKSF